MILNKVDPLPYLPFDLKTFRDLVHLLNREARVFEMSALRGEGLDQWLDWVWQLVSSRRPPGRLALTKRVSDCGHN